MSDRPATKYICCPYWSLETRKCRVQRAGLFIPLEDHVEVYCRTGRFPQCIQFSHHTTSQLLLADKLARSDNNRRKHQRIRIEHNVTLAKLSDQNRSVRIMNTAKTLDVSIGGMRLTTTTPLQSEGTIRFCFEETLPDHYVAGTGHIAWCNKQIDEPGYQAGVIFDGEGLVQAMGSYLAAINANATT